MKHPKEYRQKVYDYVEELLGRPLTYGEHDDLRDIMSEYISSVTSLQTVVGRIFCAHEWIGDKMVESGSKQTRAYVKCVKCDKRIMKRMPTVSFDA
ncbi:MAG TPA: hypothetical protein VJA87_02100 [Candidatus Paceibacterota bacterium]